MFLLEPRSPKNNRKNNRNNRQGSPVGPHRLGHLWFYGGHGPRSGPRSEPISPFVGSDAGLDCRTCTTSVEVEVVARSHSRSPSAVPAVNDRSGNSSCSLGGDPLVICFFFPDLL